MKDFFGKTFAELTTAAPLDICGLGDTPLTVCQLTGLWAVVNHRYENMLPTTTHTDKKPFELCKAIESPGYELLAYALVGRLWEMGVERFGRAAVAARPACGRVSRSGEAPPAGAAAGGALPILWNGV